MRYSRKNLLARKKIKQDTLFWPYWSGFVWGGYACSFISYPNILIQDLMSCTNAHHQILYS